MATTKTAAPTLTQLQKNLGTDARLRGQFLKDPAAVLAKSGLELPPEKADELARFTRQVTAAGGTPTIGGIKRSTVGAGARARVEVEVTVKVRF